MSNTVNKFVARFFVSCNALQLNEPQNPKQKTKKRYDEAQIVNVAKKKGSDRDKIDYLK
jgi:hypothetical protein